MQRIFFFLLTALFTIVWLGTTAYTFFSIVNFNLPYSLSLFWFFIIFLDLLALPSIFLWWKTGSKTITHKTWVLMVGVIVIFYWGFATIDSFLTLYFNALQFRWIAFAYIWEVVVVGILAAYSVVCLVRFADSFGQGEGRPSSIYSPAEAYTRIVSAPVRAALIFFSIVVFGYAIGSLQLYFFAHYPLTEIIKNLITGVITGALSSFFVFFFLERIIEPSLKKIGGSMGTFKEGTGRKRNSLFLKIYAVSGLLALISIGFFGSFAYARAQAVLEEQLKMRLKNELELLANEVRRAGGFLKDENFAERFGSKGEASVVRMESTRAGYSSFVDRDSVTKITGFLPLNTFNNSEVLKGIIYVSDFDRDLKVSLFYGFIIFLLALIAIIIISTLFARSITYPIKKIKEGGIRIGEGNFSEIIDVYTNDELEEVGIALNNTASQLKKSYLRLEEEVKKRTAELDQANIALKKQILELSKAGEREQNQIKELDIIAKRLVRRDFELLEANERLREMDEAKSRFVSIAAHQLRTPLSGIKWTVQMMIGGDFGKISKEQKNTLSKAGDSLNRLVKLIGDLLNVARIEEGRYEFIFSEVKLEEVCKKVFEDNKPLAKSRGLIFKLTTPRQLLPTIKGDFFNLAFVLENLVGNSFAYTKQGGSVEIILEKDSQDSGKARISVKDTGMGIPEFQKNLVGQKFFRADNVVREQIQGTGLGLYIVSRILEKHGSRLDFESQEGEGSEFYFSLPLLVK